VGANRIASASAQAVPYGSPAVLHGELEGDFVMKKRDSRRKRTLQERLDARLQVIRSLADAADEAVLDFKDWCLLNNISVATGFRIKNSENAPRFVKLSDKRFGITIAENRRWQEARTA
jgi:hypothetical protein